MTASSTAAKYGALARSSSPATAMATPSAKSIGSRRSAPDLLAEPVRGSESDIFGLDLLRRSAAGPSPHCRRPFQATPGEALETSAAAAYRRRCLLHERMGFGCSLPGNTRRYAIRTHRRERDPHRGAATHRGGSA